MLGDDWGELLVASGERRFAGNAGVWFEADGGKLVCTKAPLRGIDTHLFGVFKVAVVELGITIWLNSIDTGRHAPNSRHYTGRAGDMDHVQEYGGEPRAATLKNPHAVRLCEWLLDNGFRVGEGRPKPGLLFGPPRTKWNPTSINHRGHIHCSIPRVNKR